MDGVHQWMWLSIVAAQAVAAVRVAVGRPSGKHVFLLALLVSMIFFETVLNLAHGGLTRTGYLRVWLGMYLTNFGLLAMALTEACAHSIEGYERFGEAGRRLIRSVLIASGIGMLLLLFLLPDSLARNYVTYFQAQAYLGQGSLALLGIGLLAFAKWARLRLHRNAQLTMIVLTGLCAAEGLLGSSMSSEWQSVRIYAGILTTVLFWGLLVTRWSSQPEPVRSAIPERDHGRAVPGLGRLEAMNRQLSEWARRG